MFNRKEEMTHVHQTSKGRMKIIDSVTKLYVSLIKSDNEISQNEIDILYSLLINIFKRESISWEFYIRHVLENQAKINISEVVEYLNANLTVLDKIRVVFSLMVMANSDSDFSLSEITKILDLSKSLNLDPNELLEVMTAIEYKSTTPVSLKNFRMFNQYKDSIFSDFVIFGTNPECNIRFRDKKINKNEAMLFMIDDYLFIATAFQTSFLMDDKPQNPNELFVVPRGSQISFGNSVFTYDILKRIYENHNVYDIIEFRKPDYNFRIINDSNKYSIVLSSGIIHRNGSSLKANRTYIVFYDDVLQIKGYAPFTIHEVIKERREIGVENVVPKELYIVSNNDYYTISRVETSKTISFIENNNGEYFLHPPKRGWDIYLNNQKVEYKTKVLLNSDIITINRKNYRINNYYDLIEVPFEIDYLNILDVKHYHKDGLLALDSISFEARKGQLVGILGQSGCGKSTLLKCLAGELYPTFGDTIIDGKNFYQNLSFFTQYMGYVPQDDLLFATLTVYENLLYRGKMRMPNLSQEHLDQKISNILSQTNLSHRKNVIVGDISNKMLSGGERKRLNIALELLFEPTIIICDEPTSGLSYTDIEQIVEMLRNFAQQGKMIIITIHQPSTNIYSLFDNVLLMDKGGKQVFFGTPEESYQYFNVEMDKLTVRKEYLEEKREAKLPEFIYDVIEYPDYKDNGDVMYEQIKGNIAIKRKFSPDYWRDKYKRKMLFDLIQFDVDKVNTKKTKMKGRKQMSTRAHIIQAYSFLARNFKMKIRNKTNLLLTFAISPLLALIIAMILRLAPENAEYSYFENINIGIYIFISIIVFIFLGLSNSIEEILSERRSILREKMLQFKMSYYLGSKIVTMAFFTIIQAFVYNLISVYILEIPGLNTIHFVYFFLSGVIGYSLGLCVSSFLYDSKAIINILPLILIPQIIFGGAIIEYEKMNRKIKFHQANPIPEIVQFIPSRWLFEGLYTAEAKLNMFDYNLYKIEKKRLTLLQMQRKGISSSEYFKKMNVLYKEIGEVSQKYKKEICTNDYVVAAVSLMDGKLYNTNKNVFMSSMKIVGTRRFPTYYFNILIVLLYIFTLNAITMLKLKYWYKD